MKNLFCVICGKHWKFKISFIFQKKILSIIYSNGGNEDKKIFQEEESIDVLKIFGYIENIFLEEIELHELICRKHKKVCTTLDYINILLF